MAYKNGFYSTQDLVEILTAISDLCAHYKENKHHMSREDVISVREDLAMYRVQLGEIEADLFEEKLSAELSYDGAKDTKTEELVNEYAALAKTPQKVSYPEDKAKRRAKLDCYDMAVAMNKAKAIHRKASILVLNTLPDVLNSMANRVNFLSSTPPTGDNKEGRPLEKPDPYQQSGWSRIDDSNGVDSALDQVNSLENELDSN